MKSSRGGWLWSKGKSPCLYIIYSQNHWAKIKHITMHVAKTTYNKHTSYNILYNQNHRHSIETKHMCNSRKTQFIIIDTKKNHTRLYIIHGKNHRAKKKHIAHIWPKQFITNKQHSIQLKPKRDICATQERYLNLY